MLREEKWVAYAFKIIKDVYLGSNSVQIIANNIGGSESYIAKVVATLRRGGIITTDYRLSKPYDQITVADVLAVIRQRDTEEPVVRYILDSYIASVLMTVKQVLEANGT